MRGVSCSFSGGGYDLLSPSPARLGSRQRWAPLLTSGRPCRHRLCFINKLDRQGAKPFPIIDNLRSKLKLNAAAVQVPIGAEEKLQGVVDIIDRKALYFEGPRGDTVTEGPVPEDLKALMEAKRAELIEKVSEVDDGLADRFLLGEEPTPQEIRRAASQHACLQRRSRIPISAPLVLQRVLGKADVGASSCALCSPCPPTPSSPPACLLGDGLQGCHPPGHRCPQVLPRVHGHRVQEQGSAAATGWGQGLPAQPSRGRSGVRRRGAPLDRTFVQPDDAHKESRPRRSARSSPEQGLGGLEMGLGRFQAAGSCSRVLLPTPKPPPQVVNRALDIDQDEKELVLPGNPKGPAVALAFKLEEGKFGQLTFLRVYNGTISRGDTLINTNSGKKIKVRTKGEWPLVWQRVLGVSFWSTGPWRCWCGPQVPRLVRVHANELEDIQSAHSGQICAMFGVECASGDTFTDGKLNVAMTSLHVPEPVMSLAITPKDKNATAAFSKALNRQEREGHTLPGTF